MVFQSDCVRHEFPLRATYSRRSLPRVIGSPVSEYYGSIRLPKDLRSPIPLPVRLSYLRRPLMGRSGVFGVSQVPETSLITCHSLRTPAAFHDLAVCGRFLWTSRPLKRSSTATILDFGAVPAIQGVRPPLWPVTFSVYASPVLFATPCRLASTQALRHRRNTRYGWVATPCPTGTCTLQDAPSFAWRNNV